MTGFFLQQIELTPKRLELLSQTVPELARGVVLWDRNSADQLEAAREAAQSLKILLDAVECANPPYNYERALAGVGGEHRDVLLVMASPSFFVIANASPPWHSVTDCRRCSLFGNGRMPAG